MSKWINIDDICIPSDENDWDELVAFADAVAEQEPIDLVRCGECTKKGTEDCPMKDWNYTWGEYEYFNVDNDFCSYGTRRERE